jgi:hypothetical protein
MTGDRVYTEDKRCICSTFEAYALLKLCCLAANVMDGSLLLLLGWHATLSQTAW